jgi:hypothetical protein
MERFLLFCLRAQRAWRYYTRLHYSWRLSWIRAGLAIDEHADVRFAGML